MGGSSDQNNVLGKFTLKKSSPFTKLLQTLLILFEHHSNESKKLENIFTKWKLNKEKLPKRIPRKWKFIIKKTNIGCETTEKLLFCIETLLVICFKYILAINSHKYKISFSIKPFISMKSPLTHIIKLIETIDKHLHLEPYEMVFNWWFNPLKELLNNTIASETDSLAKNLNKHLSRVLKLLSEVSFTHDTDIFGDFYQRMVDASIRKAFGEFYTPLAVVESILDGVGYVKGNQLKKKTLLDPACGSGSFLIVALRRYLSDVQKEAEVYGWADILEDLCAELRISGIDINPFSCLASKIGFILELLPYYSKAIQSNPSFLPPKPPIFCSNFLLESELNDKSIDFIIGNPPYVGVTQIPKEKRKIYQKKFKTAQGRLNLYVLFIERAIDLLKPDGMLGFLLPTAFMVYSGYGRALRRYILETCYIKKMINLALCNSVFEQDVSVGIFIFQKTENTRNAEREMITSVILKTDDLHSLSSIPLVEQETSKHAVMMFPQSLFSKTQENTFSPFLGEKCYSILKKMEKGASLLGSVFNIEQCIRIGSAKTRKLVLIDEEKYNTLSSKKQKRYRKIINGKDIERYIINWKHIYLKYEAETKADKLYLAKDPSIFEIEKLFFRNTSKYLTVAYDGGDSSKSTHETYFYALNTLYTLHLREKTPTEYEDIFIKYALAYLNSPLAEFYYRAMFWGLIIPGGSMKYREVLQYLPFKVPETSEEKNIVKELVRHVDKALEYATDKHNVTGYRNQIKKINTLLFTLYECKSSEIDQIYEFLKNFCPSWPFHHKGLPGVFAKKKE